MRELTDDEADVVMANIRPEFRRWCGAGWGWPPGQEPEIVKRLRAQGHENPNGCACRGCIYGALSWEDFAAWQGREALREPTPYIDYRGYPDPSIAERLASFKARRKRQARG